MVQLHEALIHSLPCSRRSTRNDSTSSATHLGWPLRMGTGFGKPGIRFLSRQIVVRDTPIFAARSAVVISCNDGSHNRRLNVGQEPVKPKEIIMGRHRLGTTDPP